MLRLLVSVPIVVVAVVVAVVAAVVAMASNRVAGGMVLTRPTRAPTVVILRIAATTAPTRFVRAVSAITVTILAPSVRRTQPLVPVAMLSLMVPRRLWTARLMVEGTLVLP